MAYDRAITNGGSQISGAAVDRLRDDLVCLQCDYSLRGLPGDIVRCPECGMDHDVAQIVTRRWDRPWYRAPGFNRLVAPLAWLVIAGILWLLLLVLDLTELRSPSLVLSMSAAAGIVLIWVWMLVRTRRVLAIASGVQLALLAHAIFAGYIAGVIVLLHGVLGTLMTGLGLIQIVVALVMLALGVFLLRIGRHGEKYIAGICIRQYLLGDG